jgi:DNA-binding transcriptional MocR family regulator
VVALSSVSKTLAPTLRLGWIVGPLRLIEAIAHEKQLDDRGSPGLAVGLHGMSRFRSSGATRPPALVVGFAHLHEAAIARGIAAVADLLRAGARLDRRRRRTGG